MSKIVKLSDVFISYSRRNADFARKVDAAMKAEGLEVWVDWEDIPKGADWRNEIHAGVEGSDAFLFIISPDSVKSAECRIEIDLAVKNRKRIVPVLHIPITDPETQAAMHPAIGAHNWIFAREGDDWEKARHDILSVIRTDLDHVRAHTRYNVRALEWDANNREPSYLLSGQEIAIAETWLRAGLEKQPTPTPLHNEYIYASRAAALHRQRRLLAGVMVALVVSIILMVVSILLGIEANNQRIAAVSAQATAVRNAEISNSVALASSALDSTDSNQARAVSLGLAAAMIDRPPAISQRVLSEVAYQPGVVRQFSFTDPLKLTGVAFVPSASADSLQVITSTEDDTLILWDAFTGEPIRIFEGHSREVNSVAVSTDGKLAASASSDETVILWDIATGSALHTLAGHEDRVLGVAFSPDSTMVVSASRDNTLIQWNVATGELVRKLEGHTDRVFAVAYSPDGATIVSGGQDNQFIVWNAETGAQLNQFPVMGGTINSIAFSSDGQTAAIASSDGTIILWDATTGGLLRTLSGHTRVVRSVQFSPDGRFVLSGSDDREIYLWQAESGQIIQRYTALDFVRGVAFSPSGMQFVSATREGGVVLWDVFPGNLLREYQTHDGNVTSVAISPDSRLVASASEDTTLLVHNRETGELVQMFTLMDAPDSINAVAFSPDGTMLAVGIGSATGMVVVWEIATGELKWSMANDGIIETIAYSPNGTLLLAGDNRQTIGMLTRFDAVTGEILGTQEEADGPIRDLAFSPDGQRFATAIEGNVVKVFDVTDSATALRVLEGHTNSVRSVDFSPDGSKLLSASFDQTVILWDAVTGERLETFAGHTAGVRTVVFAPDGDHFASAGDDDVVFYWQLGNLDPIRGFVGHWDNVLTLEIAPDGKSLVSGSTDGRTLGWRIDTLDELTAWVNTHRQLQLLDCTTQRVFGLALSENCQPQPATEN